MDGIKKLSELYPQYYKGLPAGVSPDEVDTYVINMMFPVVDITGCILHARKKLLIPGVRSGSKSMLKDVKEARDTLNRYIALMEQLEPKEKTTFDLGTWYEHTNKFMPGGLHPRQYVRVILKDGTSMRPQEAQWWDWVGRGTGRDIKEFQLHKRMGTELTFVGKDGWIPHTTTAMPEPLEPEDVVQVKMQNDHIVVTPRPASEWAWEKDGMSTSITHYRLAKQVNNID